MMKPQPSLNYRRPAQIGLMALIVIIGGSAAWAAYAQIAGAVIATGTIIVRGKPKSVQHLDGGIVKQLHVSAGDRVKKNQPLVLLDDTSIAANLAIYERRLRDAIVLKERLVAELNNKQTFEPPSKLAKLLKLGDLKETVAQQMALLDARRLTRESQLEQFDKKISQFKNQIEGVKGLELEKAKQVDAYADEISGVAELVGSGHASKSQLLALRRAQAELRGQVSEQKAEAARLANAITETEIAKLQVNREFREQVILEMEKTDAKIDELTQQMDATRKQMGRVVIRAPVSGVVHELSLFTIGGVVQAGQTVMQIIQQHGEHEIELNVNAQSIDQIYVGQKAVVRFPAFHQRVTPELDGRILSISPSSVVDEKTGFTFYRVAVEITDNELKRLSGKKLVPGMPVEALFPTTDRTVLSYLTKPLTDHFQHVFREE